MANSSRNGSKEAQAGDDKGGRLGGNGADDVAPDDRRLPSANPSSDDTILDDHGHAGLVRFFDADSGGHFFTASLNEQNTLVATRPGLKPEGMSFLTDDQSTPGTSDVFRFFNSHDGGHFFTASAGERDELLRTRPDLVFEGAAFREHSAPAAGYVPVYRFFDGHDGGHLFTSSASERASLLASRPDLMPEGIAFYAPGS